ncbi:MAG: 50S ribosomal protein L24 [Gammaproteobacteria bacterium]
MAKIRKGDEVIVLTGKYRGQRGVVLRVLPDSDQVIVENINMVKRHTKANPMRGEAGGVIEKEAPMNISNVAIFNPMSQKADRIGFKMLEDNRKVRFFKSNNEVVDV